LILFYFLSIRTACCHRLGGLSLRCMQPDQQQGRLFPSSSSSQARSMRRSRVLACLASSIQQMNSLRPSGVRPCQSAKVAGFDRTAASRSLGALWTVPAENVSVIIRELDSARERARLPRGGSNDFYAALRHQVQRSTTFTRLPAGSRKKKRLSPHASVVGP
jgi:hypothetical protein